MEKEVYLVDRKDIVEAYRWILGREPETGLDFADLATYSESELRQSMLGSIEFQQYFINRFLSLYRFVFIRIPKTASTAVVKALETAGVPNERLDDSIPKLDGLFQNKRLISGHFTYGDVLPQLCGLRPIFFSILRDPVSRALSLYSQALNEKDHPCHEEVVSSGSLYHLLKRDGLFFEWIFNSQCRHVAGRHLFQDVQHVLNNEYYILANISAVDRLLRLVCHLAGVPLVSPVPMNRALLDYKTELSRQPDYDEACKILEWLSTEDRKLIEFARDIFVSPPLKELLADRPGVFT